MVPGIIDNHNHLVLMGNRPGFHTPLENAHSHRRGARHLRRTRARSPGRFLDHDHRRVPFQPSLRQPARTRPTGRFPTLAELDSVTPNHPVWLSISFNGPSVDQHRRPEHPQQAGSTVGTISVAAAGSSPAQAGIHALLHLRQTLLNPAERRRSTLDAMKYAASLGVTTHIDQGAFQATNTAADGAAHEDNFTMHFPFLEIYEQGKGLVRLRINFLHMEGDDATPELVQRLKNAFPFFGDDMVRTGGIGEFIAQGVAVPGRFLEAARRVAKAGWRAEVHSLGRRNTPRARPPDFELEIAAFETVNNEFPGVVRDRRWVIAHVPGITQEWIDRFQAIGGSLSLTGWQFLAGNPTTSTVAPYAGPPFRMIVDSTAPAASTPA